MKEFLIYAEKNNKQVIKSIYADCSESAIKKIKEKYHDLKVSYVSRKKFIKGFEIEK